jgi:hypothetical protein
LRVGIANAPEASHTRILGSTGGPALAIEVLVDPRVLAAARSKSSDRPSSQGYRCFPTLLRHISRSRAARALVTLIPARIAQCRTSCRSTPARRATSDSVASPSAMPTMCGARQGVGTRHRLKRETAGYPRPGKNLCQHPLGHPKWSDSGLKSGGRCDRRLVPQH